MLVLKSEVLDEDSKGGWEYWGDSYEMRWLTSPPEHLLLWASAAFIFFIKTKEKKTEQDTGVSAYVTTGA